MRILVILMLLATYAFSASKPNKGVRYNSYNVNLGINAAESFGRTYYIGGAYNYFLSPHFFAQGSGGYGLFRTIVRPESGNGDSYENDYHWSLDALLGYSMIEITLPKLQATKVIPMAFVGAGYVYQGGKPSIAYVIGFENIINLTSLNFVYGIKDRIYSPNVGTNEDFTHNFHIYIAYQSYFNF